MAYKEALRVEIPEIIRRWQAGDSQRKIASGTGLSRDTIAKYVAAAQEEGIAQDGPVPTEEQLSRLASIGQSGPRQAERPSEDLLEPWAVQIYQWLTGDRLQVSRAAANRTTGVSQSRENVRLSVQRKCHSVMPRWYQMMTPWDPPGIVALEDPRHPGISWWCSGGFPIPGRLLDAISHCASLSESPSTSPSGGRSACTRRWLWACRLWPHRQ